MLNTGFSYHIKDDYYQLVASIHFVMSNKENGGYRPHYYAIPDSVNRHLYWMIPISSQFKKYEKIYNDKVSKYGKCDTITLGRFADKDCAFLIQNAIPVTEEFIAHVHTIKGIPVKVHQSIHKEIQTKLKTCLALHKRGIKLFFPDVEQIKKILTKAL